MDDNVRVMRVKASNHAFRTIERTSRGCSVT